MRFRVVRLFCVFCGQTPFFDTKNVIVKHDVLPLNTNQASQCVRELTEAFDRAEGITEQLKATNNLLWAKEMNNCKARAEEIVLREVVLR